MENFRESQKRMCNFQGRMSGGNILIDNYASMGGGKGGRIESRIPMDAWQKEQKAQVEVLNWECH